MIICMIFSVNYLKKTNTSLKYSSTNIENAIKSNSFENAEKLLDEFSKNWDKNSSKISIFTNHNEIDSINSELLKLKQHIIYKNKEEALASINIIHGIIGSISEMESLNIINLF
nr:DUF4363 family protein [Clostridium algifaecis]